MLVILGWIGLFVPIVIRITISISKVLEGFLLLPIPQCTEDNTMNVNGYVFSVVCGEKDRKPPLHLYWDPVKGLKGLLRLRTRPWSCCLFRKEPWGSLNGAFRFEQNENDGKSIYYTLRFSPNFFSVSFRVSFFFLWNLGYPDLPA